MSLPWRRTPTREDYLLENFTSKFLLFTLIWLESSDLNLSSANRFEIWKQNKKFKYSRAPSKQLGVWRGLVRHVSFRQDYPKTKTPKATKIHFLSFWANLTTTEHYKTVNVTGNLPNSSKRRILAFIFPFFVSQSLVFQKTSGKHPKQIHIET